MSEDDEAERSAEGARHHDDAKHFEVCAGQLQREAAGVAPLDDPVAGVRGHVKATVCVCARH